MADTIKRNYEEYYNNDMSGIIDDPLCHTDNEWEVAYDNVQHPKHYNSHPSGIECKDITKWMGFCLGNVIKYVWRADLKDNAIEDLEKAREYLDIEIDKRKKHKDIENE